MFFWPSVFEPIFFIRKVLEYSRTRGLFSAPKGFRTEAVIFVGFGNNNTVFLGLLYKYHRGVPIGATLPSLG